MLELSDTETDGVTVGALDADSDRLLVEERDPREEAEPELELVSSGDAVAKLEELPEMDGDPVEDLVGLTDGVGVLRGVSVAPVLDVTLTEGEPDDERVIREDPLGVSVRGPGGGLLRVAELEVESVDDRVGATVREGLGLPEPEAVLVELAETDGERVPVRDPLSEGDPVSEVVWDRESRGEREPEPEMVDVRVLILDRVDVEDPVSEGLGVPDRVVVGVPEFLADVEELCVPVREGPMDRDCILEAVPDPERVADTVTELDRVSRVLGVSDCDPLSEGLILGVPVLDRAVDRDAVGIGVCVIRPVLVGVRVSTAEPEGVCWEDRVDDLLPDSEAYAEVVRVEVTERVEEIEPVVVSVRRIDAETEFVGEVDLEARTELDVDGERVVERLALADAELETEAVEDKVRRLLAVVEGLADCILEERAEPVEVTDAEPVLDAVELAVAVRVMRAV